MTNQTTQSSVFVRFLRGLLRLILSLLIGILIGAGLYFGFQFVYQQLVIPTQQNAVELQNLNTRVNQQWDLLQQKNEDLESRLSVLESDQKITADQISELGVQIEQNAADLGAFQIQQKDSFDKLDDVGESILELNKQIDVLTAQNEEIQTNLENMEIEKRLLPVYQDVASLKILLQINRSRLFLLQDNYGLAKEELLLADEMLNSLLLSATSDQENEILLWHARLTLAIDHLPANPILANDDLEILWTMMANGFTQKNTSDILDENTSSEVSDSTVTPQPPTTVTPTPTPTP